MNIKEIKRLFTKLEQFSVDTQPIRDLIEQVQSRKCNISNFISLLDTINLVIDTSDLKVGSSSSQLNSILELLNKKLQEQNLDTNIEVPKQRKQNLERDVVIMSALMEIKKDLESIKSKETTVIHNITKVDPIDSSSLENLKPVYIEHNIDTSHIKSNINVDSVEGNNISSKIDRLKKIKGGK